MNVLYIKFKKNTDIEKDIKLHNVRIKKEKANNLCDDFVLENILDIYSENPEVSKKVLKMKCGNVITSMGDKRMVEGIDVIKIINGAFPGNEIVFLGDTELIFDVKKQRKKITEWILVAFSALFIFVGSAYAIMAYNTDVGTTELFQRVYKILGDEEQIYGKVIEIFYAIGLFVGIACFYNHFVGINFGKEPTPLEVEMNKYEKDIEDFYKS